MSNSKLIIAAMTNMGRIRTNNEDNFMVVADLANPAVEWAEGQKIDLGENGSLLVVADGMGGMNAGEVASEIAVKTVEEWFTPQHLNDAIKKSTASIQAFLSSVVVEADKKIKAEAQSNSEARGMGTTIVLAWLLNDLCYVCWCGDSRAYLFNPASGLKRISKDHSLVQSLVDSGKITDDDAFDSPQSNIITRCLSDSQNNAQPECAAPFELCNNDLILLCTDGLCGMIRDRDIAQVIRANADQDLAKTVEQLITAALRAGGKDNVTVVASLIHNDKDAEKTRAPKPATVTSTVKPGPSQNNANKPLPGWVWAVISGLAVALIALSLWLFMRQGSDPEAPQSKTDTIYIEQEVIVDKNDAQPEPQPVATPAATRQQPTPVKPNQSATHTPLPVKPSSNGKENTEPANPAATAPATLTPVEHPAQPPKPAQQTNPDAPTNTEPAPAAPATSTPDKDKE